MTKKAICVKAGKGDGVYSAQDTPCVWQVLRKFQFPSHLWKVDQRTKEKKKNHLKGEQIQAMYAFPSKFVKCEKDYSLCQWWTSSCPNQNIFII